MTPLLSSTPPLHYYSKLAENSLSPLITSLQKRVCSVAFLAFVFLAGTLYLAYSYYQKRKAAPHLLLHFDINGTIFGKDKKKEHLREDYMILLGLAKTTVSKWDGENSREMSFKQYVDEVLHPGDKSDRQIKKEREAAIIGFLERLKTHHDQDLKNEVEKNYEASLEKCTSIEDGRRVYKVFPSFFKLLDKLRSLNIPFTIIFRTFGDDLNSVKEEIEQHPSGIQIRRFSKFNNKTLTGADGDVAIDQAAEIFKTILSSHEHVAIQDDWQTWNTDGERGRSGKPFLYDPSRKVKVLSLFFDDNITGDKEKDILKPCPISDVEPETTQALIEKKLIFSVSTIDAIIDEDYFINSVQEAIRLRS